MIASGASQRHNGTEDRQNHPSWLKPTIAAIGLAGILGYCGYAANAVRYSMLGVPHLWVPVEVSVKGGVSMLTTSAMATPLILDFFRIEPLHTLAILAATAVFVLGTLQLSDPASRVHQWLRRMLPKVPAPWLALGGDLLFTIACLRLLQTMAPVFHVQDLLSHPQVLLSPESRYLAQLIESSAGDQLTLRFFGFVLALLMLWLVRTRITASSPAPQPRGLPGFARRSVVSLGTACLVLSTLGLPAMYAPCSTVAPVPIVDLSISTDGGQQGRIAGALISHDTDWFVVYESEPRAVRMVPKDAIETASVLRRQSPFEVRMTPGGTQ
ncbi:hypothetical protein GF356_07535 [candidate division GN15 bacterium]|nr:hypothetical protein [candidate division GN15 bacterium]